MSPFVSGFCDERPARCAPRPTGGGRPGGARAWRKQRRRRSFVRWSARGASAGTVAA